MAVFNDAIGKAFDWVRTQFEADEQIQPRSVSDTVIPVYDVFADETLVRSARWWKHNQVENVQFNEAPSIPAYNDVIVQTPAPNERLTGEFSEIVVVTRAALRVERGTNTGWGSAFNYSFDKYFNVISNEGGARYKYRLNEMRGAVLGQVFKSGQSIGMPCCGYSVPLFVTNSEDDGSTYTAEMTRQIIQNAATNNNAEPAQGIGYFTNPGWQVVLQPDEHLQFQFYVDPLTDNQTYALHVTLEGFVIE